MGVDPLVQGRIGGMATVALGYQHLDRHCPDGLGYRPEPWSATASPSIGAHG
jgi:hypothetical protein